MKTSPFNWKRMTADWKPTLLVWLPIFAGLMCFGIARSYQYIVLYAIFVALATWHLCELAVSTFRKFRERTAEENSIIDLIGPR
jgi:hypothetical protein